MTRLLGTAAALAVLSALMWCAWLGWDHEYYRVDGVPQGPYRPWQVIGCGIAVTAATVLGWLRVRTALAIAVLPGAAVLGFAIPWAWDASRTDDTGLWVVGLLLLLVGGIAALTTVLALVHAVASSPAVRRRP